MPPKSSKSPTASKPPIELNLAAVEDDISGLTLNDGEVHDIDEKSAPIGPGAKARRRRNREKSRRLERSKDAEADDAASKTPKERDSISEAGNAEPNDVSDTDTIATEPLPQFRLDHPPRHVMPISLNASRLILRVVRSKPPYSVSQSWPTMSFASCPTPETMKTTTMRASLQLRRSTKARA